MKVRITYNAPVVLTFTLAAIVVYLLPQSMHDWFQASPNLHGAHAYVGLFSHILGHANWQHLLGNFMLILLIGPILEERHGSLQLLFMMLVTALVTGLVYATFSGHGLMGASGIVFMMILLASTANIRQGEIPLTFIAIAIIYLGGELVQMFKSDDQVAHGAHMIGGLAGAVFGFVGARVKSSKVEKKLVVGGLKPLAEPKPRAATKA